jgi:mRNA-degrading endonuclease toxin of MazEF toxin-antitoxin module
MFANCPDVAVVVCSTHRRTGRPRPFEVLVGTADGFEHDTIIDCRFPFTVSKQIRGMDLRPLFRLSPDVMLQVSEALVVGLQM